jgi:hypothetical protein
VVARWTPVEKQPKCSEVIRESTAVRRYHHRTKRRGGGLPEIAARHGRVVEATGEKATRCLSARPGSFNELFYSSK